jgi:hypothetical protein
MPLSKRKVAELYTRLEEFGMDVSAIKKAGFSPDELEVLYHAVKIVEFYRMKEEDNDPPRFHSLSRDPLA